MADYWISFRITDNATYHDRYNGLIAALNAHATKAWETDTSFLAIRSGSTIDQIGEDAKAALNGTTDHFVIRQIDYINTRYINDPGDDFLSFFPKAIKL